MTQLRTKGHTIIAVVRPKDVLVDLCEEYNLKYIKLNERPESGGALKLAFTLLKRDIQVLRIALRTKPDLMIGSDGSIARVGFLTGIPSFEMSEDDARAIKLYAFISYTFFSKIISPNVVDAWLWNKKKVGYDGYQKLAYLHPNYFKSDISIKNKYVSDEKYFILRFSALNAYHDIGIKGFDENSIFDLIRILEKYGKVFISSEKKLSPALLPYTLKINPSDLHHVMSYATMLIGDSQSMTVEAALLGLPSIRYSGLVGKLSVLEELEHIYDLTYGFKPSEMNQMFAKTNELLEINDISSIWRLKRDEMLKDKIDVTAFYVWYIENYPISGKTLNNHPNFLDNFK